MKNIRLSSMLIPTLCASLLASTVALAEGNAPSYVEGNRAPKGFARPPFHTKPRASTATVAGLTPALARHAYGFDTIANQGDGMVVAIVDGDLTLKRLARSSGGWILRAENPAFRSIPLEGETEMVIWGVVTFNIHRHR